MKIVILFFLLIFSGYAKDLKNHQSLILASFPSFLDAKTFIKNKLEHSDTSLSVIQRVFTNIKEYKMFINEEDYIYITVSIGINKTPSKSKNFLEAFKLADLALYEAKESGRDTIRIYGEN